MRIYFFFLATTICVISCGQSPEDAIKDIFVPAEEIRAADEANARELAKIGFVGPSVEDLMSVEKLDGFSGVYWRGDVTIQNPFEWPIASMSAQGEFFVSGRSVPIANEQLVISIPGGIEPEETRTIEAFLDIQELQKSVRQAAEDFPETTVTVNWSIIFAGGPNDEPTIAVFP